MWLHQPMALTSALSVGVGSTEGPPLCRGLDCHQIQGLWCGPSALLLRLPSHLGGLSPSSPHRPQMLPPLPLTPPSPLSDPGPRELEWGAGEGGAAAASAQTCFLAWEVGGVSCPPTASGLSSRRLPLGGPLGHPPVPTSCGDSWALGSEHLPGCWTPVLGTGVDGSAESPFESPGPTTPLARREVEAWKGQRLALNRTGSVGGWSWEPRPVGSQPAPASSRAPWGVGAGLAL